MSDFVTPWCIVSESTQVLELSIPAFHDLGTEEEESELICEHCFASAPKSGKAVCRSVDSMGLWTGRGKAQSFHLVWRDVRLLLYTSLIYYTGMEWKG